MPQNDLFRSPVLFFISRLLILAGMVLFFMSVFYFAGVMLCIPLFDVNPLAQPEILLSYTTDPKVLRAMKFLQSFISIGIFVVPAWFFPKALKQDPASFLQAGSSFTLRDLGLGLALIIVSAPLVSWLVNVNEHITFPASMAGLEQQLKASEDLAQELSRAFVQADSFGELLLNLFIVAVVPAICEELLFRGALQQFIRMCFRNGHAAVWSAAIIFSAFHQQFYGFLPRLVLGAMLGYMFLYSGSLWVSVIAHFINNALALLGTYYHWNDGDLTFMKEDYVFPVYINILSFAACIASVYLMRRYSQKKIWYNGE